MRTIKHYIRDIIYGANDGIITTFAIMAGVVGANLSPSIIVIMGFANLFADGFSMAISNYQAIESEGDARGSRAVHPLGSAVVTFLSFFIAGLIPLLPYLILPRGTDMFVPVLTATGIALFIIGALRASFARKHFIRTGVETMFVGALAATIAYGVGAFVESLVR